MHAVGQVISGKYKLLRLLGDGGMGAVYEAEHLVLGTHVAIKMLHPDLVRRSGLAERFLQEARVSAQIRSPHVVQVLDVDKTPEGAAYLVMELLRGEPLSSVMRREGTLSVGTALDYGTQILVALEAAHALGVIHRDLKPDNVFVTFDGGRPVLKLIDFGIAKLRATDGGATKNLTVAGMLMGTPEYMAPEQLYSADKVDVRADLFSVGCMIYEMLSGRTPTSGEDPRVVVLKAERGEVTPLVHAAPNVPPEIAGLVHRAMAPRPELRFANATEMRIALEAAANGKREANTSVEAPRAEARDGKTGTVMGAPAAPVSPSSAPGPYGSTVRAAPVGGTQMGQVAPAPLAIDMARPTSSHDHAPRARRRQGRGLVVGLAFAALLLGAGAVVAYVSTQDDTKAAAPVFDPGTPTATTPSTPATTPTSTTVATAPTSAPPLAPGPAQPATPPRATTSAASSAPAASGSAAPAGSTPPAIPVPAVTIPPIVLPTALPSGLPTALPSGLPLPPGFQLPSAIPTVWPPPAPVQGE